MDVIEAICQRRSVRAYTDQRSLSIPDDYAPVFPVVVSYPSGEVPPVQRRAPEFLVWQ